LQLFERTVEPIDFGPIRLLRPLGPRVNRSDRRLNLVRAGRSMAQRLLDQHQALVDERPIPPAPVLILEQHDLAFGIEPGGRTRMLEEQQRCQPEDLRLTRKQPESGDGARNYWM